MNYSCCQISCYLHLCRFSATIGVARHLSKLSLYLTAKPITGDGRASVADSELLIAILMGVVFWVISMRYSVRKSENV